MRTIDEVEAYLRQSLNGDVRGLLVARGTARAMMRRNGVMPDDAPPFARAIDTDLAEFGFAVLDASLELKALNGSRDLRRDGFRLAGQVFEALIKNNTNDRPERGFQRIIASASYHLASYSAVAFALFAGLNVDDQNLNALERALVKLVLRDMADVRDTTREWLLGSLHRDAELREQLITDEGDHSAVLANAIITGGMRSLAYF